MNGTVIPFRRPAKRAPVRPTRKGLAVVLRVDGDTVVMLADDVELELDPAQARELGSDLIDLADDADGGGLSNPAERLRLLTRMVEALDAGELRLSQLMAGVRQLVGVPRG